MVGVRQHKGTTKHLRSSPHLYEDGAIVPLEKNCDRLLLPLGHKSKPLDGGWTYNIVIRKNGIQ